MVARQLIRTGAVIVAGQAAVALLGVAALRLYTELVPADVFGESNLILSALGLGLQLFVAGFTAVQLRYYSEAEARGAGAEFTRETLSWSLRATGALTVIALVTLRLFQRPGHMTYGWPIVCGGAAWLFTMAVRNVLMSRFQAARRQLAYVGLQVVEAMLLLSVTVSALRLSPRVESYLLGQTVAVAILIGVILTVKWDSAESSRSHAPIESDFLRRAWSYGLPFAPMSFLSWLANLGDRYTLAILLGSGAAGRYVAPFSIASRGMLFANSALCDLFRPLLFDAENRRDHRHARWIFRRWIAASVALSAAGLTLIYFAGPLIVRLLLAAPYRDGAVRIMLWVACGYAVCGVTQVIENRVLSLGYSGWLLAPMVVGAVANVGFSIVLIRHGGIVGAAQATCASFAVQNLVTFAVLVLARRRYGGGLLEEAQIEVA